MAYSSCIVNTSVCIIGASYCISSQNGTCDHQQIKTLLDCIPEINLIVKIVHNRRIDLLIANSSEANNNTQIQCEALDIPRNGTPEVISKQTVRIFLHIGKFKQRS